jgi:hypothetical protein
MQLNDAIKRFKSFLLSVTFSPDPQYTPWMSKGNEYLFTRGDLSVLLTGSDHDDFIGALSDLYLAVAEKETLSRGSVENLAIDAAAKVFRFRLENQDADFGEVAEEAVRGLKGALLTKPSLWEIVHIIGGISAEGLPIQIGKIKFLHAGPEPIAEFYGTRPDSLTRSLIENRILARVPVTAIDADAADALAVKLLRRTLDCINFFGNPKRTGARAYIIGEQSAGLTAALRLCESDPKKSSYLGFRYGPLSEVPLQRVLKQPAFVRISTMLAAPVLSSLEERLLTAFQWAGRAQVDPRREESFLLFAIALESLLLGRANEGNLGFRLGLRCAHLIGASDSESRQQMFQNIQRLYKLRSDVVHVGAIEVPESELELMREYARVALYVLLNKEPFVLMKTEKELNDWFQTALLGNPILRPEH